MIPGNPRSVADRPRERQPQRAPCLGCWIVASAVVSCVCALAIWAAFAAQVVRL